MTQTKRTTAARKKPARKSSRAGSVLAWLFGIAAAGIASGLLLAVFVFAFIYRQLPPIDTLADYRPRVPLRVWSADGKLIGEFGEERRDFVRLSEVPEHVKHAILAAEDDGFYEHPGIEITGIIRAALSNALTAGAARAARPSRSRWPETSSFRPSAHTRASSMRSRCRSR